MFSKTKIAFAAALVLGSATFALADDYTDLVADGVHNTPVAQQAQSFTGKPAALTNSQATGQWIDRASQNVDGGY